MSNDEQQVAEPRWKSAIKAAEAATRTEEEYERLAVRYVTAVRDRNHYSERLEEVGADFREVLRKLDRMLGEANVRDSECMRVRALLVEMMCNYSGETVRRVEEYLTSIGVDYRESLNKCSPHLKVDDSLVRATRAAKRRMKARAAAHRSPKKTKTRSPRKKKYRDDRSDFERNRDDNPCST